MKNLILTLKEWHWLHTWSKWQDAGVFGIRYPWTGDGMYAGFEQKQVRVCELCGKKEGRVIEL